MHIRPQTARDFLKQIFSKTRTWSGGFGQSDVNKPTPFLSIVPMRRDVVYDLLAESI